MSKLPPDMPDFLKKNEEEVNPQKLIPPPIPEHLKKPEPEVPVTKVEEKKKTRFDFGKNKIPLIEFRNDQGEMVPSAAPAKDVPEKTFNDYFTPVVGQILCLLLVISVGTGLFYYYQAEAYKNRFQAMDTRVLSFTKEIASLNQENNALSGKIVNYQKELEGRSDVKIQELQKQVTDLQSHLSGTKTTPAIGTTTTAPVNATTVVKPVEAADPVPSSRQPIAPSATAAPTAPVTTKLTPEVSAPVTARPGTPFQRPITKATDPSINYESRLKTKGELSCLQYYKTENLKKCQGRDTKYTAVMIGSKNTPTGTKLTYQCQGSGTKPLNFKYGPMEIYNNCVGR